MDYETFQRKRDFEQSYFVITRACRYVRNVVWNPQHFTLESPVLLRPMSRRVAQTMLHSVCARRCRGGTRSLVRINTCRPFARVRCVQISCFGVDLREPRGGALTWITASLYSHSVPCCRRFSFLFVCCLVKYFVSWALLQAVYFVEPARAGAKGTKGTAKSWRLHRKQHSARKIYS